MKEYAEVDGLMRVYFNARSIVGITNELRAWISVGTMMFWSLRKDG